MLRAFYHVYHGMIVQDEARKILSKLFCVLSLCMGMLKKVDVIPVAIHKTLVSI